MSRSLSVVEGCRYVIPGWNGGRETLRRRRPKKTAETYADA
jgi:hypothetical protein